MANKLIINNRSELSDLESLELIINVVKNGRISNKNKQYCYGTIIEYNGINYEIFTDLNKNGDRFVIMQIS